MVLSKGTELKKEDSARSFQLNADVNYQDPWFCMSSEKRQKGRKT
jgi:hypothetical protein